MIFRFGSVKVDEVTRESGVYYGRNYHSDVSFSHKSNEGFGQLKGTSNHYVNNVAVVFDEDEVDTQLISDADFREEDTSEIDASGARANETDGDGGDNSTAEASDAPNASNGGTGDEQ